MSVSYYLNKPVKLGDVKKIGLTVIDNRKESPDYCPFGITNEIGDGVGVIEMYTDGSDCEDDWVIKELEGRFSTGGATVILEICDKLDCKFITDEDLQNTYDKGEEYIISEETFNERTEAFRKMLTDK